MYLTELCAKYNLPVRHIKEFFDKHNILTLSYAHIDSKAIKLFEKNLDAIRKNIQIENIPKEKLEGPKILGRIELPIEKHKTEYKPKARLLIVSRILGIDTRKIIEFLIKKGSNREDVKLVAPLSKEMFEQLKNEFDKDGVLKEDSFDFNHSSRNSVADVSVAYEKIPEIKFEDFSYKRYREFKPLLSIGKLLFFDYRKNKFGIIKEVKNAVSFDPPKVFVYENGLGTTRSLFDNDIVVFTLTKDHQGFIATNLIKISELKFQEIEPFLSFISIKDLANVDGFPSGSSWQSIDDAIRNKLINFFLSKKEPDAWYYLLKIGNEADINTYISQYRTNLSDLENISYLKKTFSFKLLETTIADWKSKEPKELLDLAEVSANKVGNLSLSTNFLNCILEATFTFDETWKLYSVFKDTRILQKVVETISFEHFSSVSRLKTVLEEILHNDHLLRLIKAKFQEDMPNLTASRIIEIYQDLKPLALITTDEDLMNLLGGKKLTINEFEHLLTSLLTIPSKSVLKNLMISMGQSLSSWKLKELIKTHSTKIDIATTLIDGFLEIHSETYEIDDLVSSIKSLEGTALLNYLVTNHSKQLANSDALKLLSLAKKLKNIKAQKEAYSNIKIDSESKLSDLIEEFITLKLSRAVLDANKPLTAFVGLINQEGVPAISKEIYQFIFSHAGIAQCFLVKNLVYKVYKKKISLKQLTTIINSIQWTEISAILVQAFITANNYSEKFIIETLNDVFKKHFQVLLSQNFDSKSFQETFTIKNIVPKCNGRKHYDAELWRRNGNARWYYKNSVTITNKGHVVDYCEGRPWKKESLWNSATNQPTPEHYEFYWCRGGYCAQRNDTLDYNMPFYKWTIIEISDVLNINLDKLSIATLTGWINRMNEIVERLYCRSCDEVLRPYPFQPKTLGIYGVPMFQCVNYQCEMHEQPIRFTHCLNGKCHEILDSRDCEKCCGTGLICNHCGTKCPRCVGYDAGVQVQQTW